MNQAILFAAAIIIAGFVPLFTLSGIEGHIFGPMAKTYGYAIAGGLIATFTISPALSALLLPDSVAETETSWCASLRRVYEPVVEFALANRIVTLGGLGVLIVMRRRRDALAGTGVPAEAGGGQLLDPRDAADVDLARGGQRLCQSTCGGIIRASRKSRRSISQHGRPDDGTDATGFFNAEFFVPLKPFDTWPRRRGQGQADRSSSPQALEAAVSRAWNSTSRSTSRTTSRRPPRG